MKYLFDVQVASMYTLTISGLIQSLPRCRGWTIGANLAMDTCALIWGANDNISPLNIMSVDSLFGPIDFCRIWTFYIKIAISPSPIIDVNWKMELTVIIHRFLKKIIWFDQIRMWDGFTISIFCFWEDGCYLIVNPLPDFNYYRPNPGFSEKTQFNPRIAAISTYLKYNASTSHGIW